MNRTIILVLFGVLSASAFASSQKVGDYTWSYNVVGRGVEIVGTNYGAAVSPKPSGRVVIPERLGGIPVVAIGYNSFYNCGDITEVVIPSTVVEIGDYAFYVCRNMKEVHIPKGVKSIGNGAFSSCVALEVVELPSTIDHIGYSAFWDCDKIVSVAWPPQFQMREHLPQSFDKIEMLQIPEGVADIGDRAYAAYYSITSVVFCAGITNIGERAFMSDIGIKELSLPTSLRAIRNEAFMGCGGIEELELNDGLELIGDYAFKYCDGIKSVRIPKGVSIGEDAFSYCPSLENVNLFGVDIPVAWTAKFKDLVKDCNDDVVAALRRPTGKTYGNNIMEVWHDYVIGTDPTDPNDVLKATIVMQNGQPVVSCIPPPHSPEYWGQIYRVWAKKSLDDAEWTEVHDHITSDYHFFMVTVELFSEPKGYQGQWI